MEVIIIIIIIIITQLTTPHKGLFSDIMKEII